MEAIRVEGIFQNDTVNNHWRGSAHKGLADVGSAWTAVRSFCDISPTEVEVKCAPWWAPTNYGGYKGPLLVGDSSMISADKFLGMKSYGSSELALQAYGTTAINRVKPTNPIVDLPTAVGELIVDGLPNMIGTSILHGGRVSGSLVADEYLNGVFGLVPFWRDLTRFHEAVTNANSVIARYIRDSGKAIRRKHELPIEVSTEVVQYDNGGGYAGYVWPLRHSTAGSFTAPAYGGYSGEREDVVTIEKKQWFSGAFTYYLPKGSGMNAEGLLRDLATAKKLYGGLGASTVWNLLPFSWAADWFTNAGDVISNIDSFTQDGLVMLWGYVMEKLSVTERRTVRGCQLGSLRIGNQLPSVITTDVGVVYQRRRKATPFGFGLSESELSARQWSILGALGLQGHLL